MGALQGLPDLNTIRGEEGRALSTSPWTRNPSRIAFTIACMQSVLCLLLVGTDTGHGLRPLLLTALYGSCLLGLGMGYDISSGVLCYSSQGQLVLWRSSYWRFRLGMNNMAGCCDREVLSFVSLHSFDTGFKCKLDSQLRRRHICHIEGANTRITAAGQGQGVEVQVGYCILANHHDVHVSNCFSQKLVL